MDRVHFYRYPAFGGAVPVGRKKLGPTFPAALVALGPLRDLRYPSRNMTKPPKQSFDKSRRRPTDDKGPTMTFRVPIELRDRIDCWAAVQPDKPARSEAVRRLVEVALSKVPIR